MNKIINRRSLLGLLGAGVIAATVPTSAEAAGYVRWNRPTVYVWSTIPSIWYVGTAVEAWDDSSKLELITTYTTPDPASSIIKIKYGRPPGTARAYCDCDYDGLGRIKSATITISDRINLSALSKDHRIALIRHEVGHALGFDHSSTGRDVMYRQPDRPCDLSQFHKDRLRQVYGS